ncbi:MAG: flagellar export protein FliJ [Planctomycetota bacterium]|jgi:flagellar export protein FliJ
MNKRFIFSYDTMLKLRKDRESQHKHLVADRLRRIGQINRQIGSLQQQIAGELESIRAGCESGTINIKQAIGRRYWLSHLQKGILESEARLGYHEARLAQERAELIRASKQRRMLEKLRHNQFNRYNLREHKRQTDWADDMSTVRYLFDRVTSLERVTR